MKLVPLARSLAFALALGVVVSPAAAHRRVHHDSGPGMRPGHAAVHWLRHEHGKRLVTGATNFQLEAMSRDPGSFLEGACELMDYDLEHQWAWAAEPGGPIVTRVGNASVRNLGTVRDGRGYTAYDWLSFDFAGPGHALNDLRQMLVSLVLLGQELDHDDSDIAGVILEAMRTYRDGIGRMSGQDQSRDWAMTAERGNTFTRRMLNIASHRRREDLLDRWTVVGHQGRRFKLEREFASIETHQAAAYWQALRALRTEARPDSYWMVKDAVVRSENGKHSGPHHQVYLLIEGPTASLTDDFILEAHLACQDAKCVQQQAWKIRRAPEPFFGVVNVDGQSYVLREVQPEWMPFATDRVESLDDYYDVGRAAATLLARAHAVTAEDQQALGHFARDWAASPHEIEGKLAHFAMRYAAQVHADQEALSRSWTPRHTLVKPPHKHGGHHRAKAAVSTTEAPPTAVKATTPELPSTAHKIVPQPPPPAPNAPAAPPQAPGSVPQPLQPPEEGR